MSHINMSFNHKGVEVHVQSGPTDISKAVEAAKNAADLAVAETPKDYEASASKTYCNHCYKPVQKGAGHVCKPDPTVEALEGFLAVNGYSLAPDYSQFMQPKDAHEAAAIHFSKDQV
ncbi:hypothetical protein AAG587_08355 [Vreelandella neptunia]|uniref:hypothetical protein n=1 Tax=Vreelandella neptunia TaxID=115551 RepID=UPI00315B348A